MGASSTLYTASTKNLQLTSYILVKIWILLYSLRSEKGHEHTLSPLFFIIVSEVPVS